MANILAVGIATLDIINTVEQFPSEDAEVRALSQQLTRGGNATNTLSILSQLGHECAWAGVLIDEPDSALIKQDLQRHNINYSHCDVLDQGKMPTSYITLNQQTGSRTIVHHRDCPEFDFNHFKKIDLTRYDWLHFEGRNCSETLKMLQYCQQHYPKLRCSLEIEKPRPDIEGLYDFADILLFSKHFVQSQGFQTAESFLTSLPTKKKLVCAWGDQGAWLLDENKNLLHSNAYTPVKIIDTLGAGDTFNAALIHGFLNKPNDQSALNFACLVAGYKCGQHGLNITHFNE